MKEYTGKKDCNGTVFSFTIIDNVIFLISHYDCALWRIESESVYYTTDLQGIEYEALSFNDKYNKYHHWTEISSWTSSTYYFVYTIFIDSNLKKECIPDWFTNLVLLHKLQE